MSIAEGRKLKVGDKVRWTDGMVGTVREISYAGVTIEWADGQWALMPFGNDRCPWQSLSREVPA